ncbi:Protein Polybromo-1 [Manis pentadactyla]|nr:Protein Polybromo-1 [Manis pentadactyla]
MLTSICSFITVRQGKVTTNGHFPVSDALFCLVVYGNLTTSYEQGFGSSVFKQQCTFMSNYQFNGASDHQNNENYTTRKPEDEAGVKETNSQGTCPRIRGHAFEVIRRHDFFLTAGLCWFDHILIRTIREEYVLERQCPPHTVVQHSFTVTPPQIHVNVVNC